MGNQKPDSHMHFGMGLYITSSIVKQHDGDLLLRNNMSSYIILLWNMNKERA